MFPVNLKYTEAHIWVLKEKGSVTIGVTTHVLDELGDISHLELPEVGDAVEHEMTLGEIDSAADATEIISPVAGEVSAVNNEIVDDPTQLSRDCYEDGWLVKITPSEKLNNEDLLTPEEYEQLITANSEDDDDDAQDGPFMGEDDEEAQ